MISESILCSGAGRDKGGGKCWHCICPLWETASALLKAPQAPHSTSPGPGLAVYPSLDFAFLPSWFCPLSLRANILGKLTFTFCTSWPYAHSSMHSKSQILTLSFPGNWSPTSSWPHLTWLLCCSLPLPFIYLTAPCSSSTSRSFYFFKISFRILQGLLLLCAYCNAPTSSWCYSSISFPFPPLFLPFYLSFFIFIFLSVVYMDPHQLPTLELL